MKKDVENMMQPDRVAEAVTYLAEKKKQGEYTISDYYAIPEDVTLPYYLEVTSFPYQTRAYIWRLCSLWQKAHR